MDQKNDVINSNKPSERKKIRTVDIIALVICLASAFLIWLFVVNTNKTVVEKTIIVTVDAKSQIEDATGLSIISGRDMTDFSQFKVTLKVSGTQNLLDRYSDEDYVISIRTDPIKEGGSGKYTVRFNDPQLPNEGLTLNSMEPAYFDAFVDELTEKEVTVKASVSEGGVSEGEYEVYPIVSADNKAKMEKVRIRGPKTTIDTIAQVNVKVNIANYQKSTVVKSQTFEFIDVNGVPYKGDNNYITVKKSESNEDIKEIDVNVVIKYIEKPIAILSTPKYTANDTDRFDYDVKISFSDNTEPILHLTGDSELFPSEHIDYDLGDITEKSSFSITVEQFVKEHADLKGLTVNPDDLAKVLNITISKKEIVVDDKDDSTSADVTGNAPNGSPSDDQPSPQK